MSKKNTRQTESQTAIIIDDLKLDEAAIETVKGGDAASIRVHYDTGYGNRLTIRGSAPDGD